MARFTALVLLLLALPASAHTTAQTLTVSRVCPRPERALQTLHHPERWPSVFREVEEVTLSVDDEGRLQRVVIRSPSGAHPHALHVSAVDNGLRFAFDDEEHDVAFDGRLWVDEELGQLAVQIRLTRRGLLTLLPDALVAAQVRRFVANLLADLATTSRPPAPL